ncbi:MAG: M56 family metallopeptidase, partial [Vicinamibacterales bacterium]
MMPTISSALENPYLVFVGWVLLVILWHTTALAMVLAGWQSWRARATPRETYRAAALAFTIAVVLAAITPALLFAVPARSHEGSSGIGNRSPASTVAPAGLPSATSLSAEPRVSLPRQSARSRGTIFADMLAATAAIAWAVGVITLLFRLTGGWLVAAAVHRQAMTEDASDTLAAYTRLKADLRIPSHVRLLRSGAVEGPVVIGWRRPALILPADATGRLSPAMIEALLAHELEHVKRRDYLLNLFQSIGEAVLFFSPALLWISRRIREAREYCCDDAAVARCGDARDYVQALTTLASLGTLNTTRPAMGAAGPRLITRVRRLLQGEAMPKFRILRVAASAALLVLVAVTG